MKSSELLKEIQKAMDLYGDRDVVFFQSFYGGCSNKLDINYIISNTFTVDVYMVEKYIDE